MVGFVSSRFPFQHILLKSFIRNLEPIFHKPFSLALWGKAACGKLPSIWVMLIFSLVRIHKVIDGIQHTQLDRKLLMLLDRYMIEFFRSVADLSGRIINTVSQNISDSFPPDYSVQ